MAASKQTAMQREAFWRAYSEHRYGVLLIILLALLTGPPLLLGLGRSALWLDFLMSLAMLAAIVSLGFESHQRLFALILGLPTIALSLGSHALTGESSAHVLLLGQLCEVAFLFVAAVLVVKSLFAKKAVSFDSILGALCGYLFVGLGWSVCYIVLQDVHPGSFAYSRSAEPLSENARIGSELLTYYSFVTLTTVGYGDIAPVTPAARTFAWMEAMVGQFYLAVIVAGLVSLIVSKNLIVNAMPED